MMGLQLTVLHYWVSSSLSAIESPAPCPRSRLLKNRLLLAAIQSVLEDISIGVWVLARGLE